MFLEAITRLNETLTREQKRDIRQVLLLIQTEAQYSLGECPFCEVPIGSSNHWVDSCPFAKMEIVNNTLV